MRARLVLAGLLVATAATFAVFAACNDPEEYVYSAAPFDTVNDCLDPYQGIDVVSGGTGADNCAPVCIVGSGLVYVSTVCPPLPDPSVWDESGQNGACAAALSAFARMDMCNPDGGSSNPWVMQDGSTPPTGDTGDDDGSTDDGSMDDGSMDDGSMDDSSTADAGVDAPQSTDAPGG
jgi:hypothetical protein